MAQSKIQATVTWGIIMGIRGAFYLIKRRANSMDTPAWHSCHELIGLSFGKVATTPLITPVRPDVFTIHF